ncbi:MAG: carboxypeptidase-like regulatory domain-containing protein [Pseudobacter sp.]|uniref:carboxypeptidase-like regulatory domain-containing protein n=1 Tax=Pseudobacter sp. TaxID=2045420 RepID=UPI003F7E9D05
MNYRKLIGILIIVVGVASCSKKGHIINSNLEKKDHTGSSLVTEDYNYFGTIIDSVTSNPIPGADVIRKGVGSGVFTDADGKFNITVQMNTVLVCSMIGYIPREINAGIYANLGTIKLRPEPE